jgi:hypothetical protein
MERGPTQQLIRPTVDTKFHIDYGWWERADRGLDVYLRSHLCPRHQQAFRDVDASAEVDHVDPDTAEVTRVPAIQDILTTHCSREPDYITPQMSLTNAVFRVFLANGNVPLSSRQLGKRLERPPQVILRMLSGPRVYKGIRPTLEE